MSDPNLALAAELAEIAALLSMRRGERFRARAFRRVGRMVAVLPVEIATLDAAQRRGLDGVGPAIERVINEHLRAGTSAYLTRLRAEEPAGVGRLVQVMGVSARLARTLSERGITDLEDLARAVQDGSIRQVEGVGERTAEVIADGLGRVDLAIAQALPVLREARMESARWARAVAGLEGIERVEVAGDVRRGVRQPAALTLLAVHNDQTDPVTLLPQVVALDGCLRELDRSADRVDVLTTSGRTLTVHLTASARAGSALVVATGSVAHVQELQQAGMGDDAADEATAYRTAGRPVVAPPLREVDAPPTPQRLVGMADLRGDGHVHSEWSGDGHDPIDELARAARARGYDWLAITDHAENLSMNGLSREQLRRRDAAIVEARTRHPDVALLCGLELNIGLDGGLDYDLETLLGQDWCVASIHSTFQRPEAVQTERILTAIAHPAVDAIGHPVGRMLGVRPGYPIDLHAIAQAAAETGTALEVNGSPRRLDLDSELVAIAVAAGAPLVLSSDAHRAIELDYVTEAVLTAQRGGAPVELVRNAGDPPHMKG